MSQHDFNSHFYFGTVSSDTSCLVIVMPDTLLYFIRFIPLFWKAYSVSHTVSSVRHFTTGSSIGPSLTFY